MRAFKLEEFDYVLFSERELPPEDQTTFRLRPITAPENKRLQDLLVQRSNGSGHTLNPGTAQYAALMAGLRGWSNLQDDEGNPVEFEAARGAASPLGKSLTGCPTPESLDKIQPAMTELANAIIDGAEITKDDAKN